MDRKTLLSQGVVSKRARIDELEVTNSARDNKIKELTEQLKRVQSQVDHSNSELDALRVTLESTRGNLQRELATAERLQKAVADQQRGQNEQRGVCDTAATDCSRAQQEASDCSDAFVWALSIVRGVVQGSVEQREKCGKDAHDRLQLAKDAAQQWEQQKDQYIGELEQLEMYVHQMRQAKLNE